MCVNDVVSASVVPQLLRQIDGVALHNLVVAHISENNNCRELAERELLTLLDSLDQVIFAEQAAGFDWLEAKDTG